MDRERLHAAIVEEVSRKPFPDDPGPPKRGGCHMLAVAIKDALFARGIMNSELRQDPDSQHVVVALGPLRLDGRGAWPLANPPEDLPGWVDVPVDASWGGFDNRLFREEITARLIRSFARHGIGS